MHERKTARKNVYLLTRRVGILSAIVNDSTRLMTPHSFRLRQSIKVRALLISAFVWPRGDELEIVEIGSSVSEASRVEPRMVYSASAMALKWISW